MYQDIIFFYSLKFSEGVFETLRRKISSESLYNFNQSLVGHIFFTLE